jgi:hypothetical protein
LSPKRPCTESVLPMCGRCSLRERSAHVRDAPHWGASDAYSTPYALFHSPLYLDEATRFALCRRRFFSFAVCCAVLLLLGHVAFHCDGLALFRRRSFSFLVLFCSWVIAARLSAWVFGKRTYAPFIPYSSTATHRLFSFSSCRLAASAAQAASRLRNCSTAGGTTCAVTWDLAERQSMVRQGKRIWTYGC